MSLASQTTSLANRVGLEVKSLWTAVNAKAPAASPAFTGTPTAPTATAGTSTTQVATTAFVATAVASGGGGGAKTYVQATQPSSMSTGDGWLDTTVTI